MVFGLFRGRKKKKTARRKVRRKARRKKKKRRKKKARRKKARRKGGKRKPFGGYQIKPDAKLGAVIGMRPVTPSQMTKKIWQYIKRKRLARK